MKILLINPGWSEESLWSMSWQKFYKWPPFSLAMVAALTPRKHDVVILDENVEKINYEKVEADLVGITVMTPLAPRSYEIAHVFHDRGIPVIFGGIHPTMLPDEALLHGDAVVLGEAENQWNRVVTDVESGALKRKYRCEKPSLKNLPSPRIDLLKKNAYFTTNVVQTTRGCPFRCDFCAVSAFFNGEYRTRPVEDVVAEISRLDGKHIFFVDDNIVSNIDYAKELFKKLTPLGKQWYSQCSLTIALDDDILKLAAESGCRGLLVGFESISEACIKEVHKINVVKKYKRYVHDIQNYGIAIEGAFIFGFDNDNKEIFQKTVDFCHDLDLDAAQFSILTPFPGTRLFNKFREEGRIFTYDWSKYDIAHVVFIPKKMRIQELYDGFLHAYSQFYSVKSILSRLFRTNLNRALFFMLNFGLFFMINFGFRGASKRLSLQRQ